ncbi:RlpA-like double-psi beta-barrel-protein domain-containing protein-containing protein [Xylariaceae sp. FL1651]|nr:RlpA-like double-psi beta-barrel-protein domain-containing protein-containing protein [Xylariaceae sp. FL1651]
MVSFTKLYLTIAVASVTVSAIPMEADLSELELADDRIDLPSDPSSNGIVDNGALESRATVHHGDLTYYTPGLGACGVTNGPNDAIVAISHVLFDPKTPGGNPNNNPLCGKKIKIQRDGKAVTVTVRDRCEACKEFDLDVPVKVFEKLAPPRLGRVKVSWNWL